MIILIASCAFASYLKDPLAEGSFSVTEKKIRRPPRQNEDNKTPKVGKELQRFKRRNLSWGEGGGSGEVGLFDKGVYSQFRLGLTVSYEGFSNSLIFLSA